MSITTELTKAKLVRRVFKRYKYRVPANKRVGQTVAQIDASITCLIDTMIDAMSQGHRIEIRKFGGFSFNFCNDRMGRNPQNGESMFINAKYVPHFKPSAQLKDRVNYRDSV